MKFSGINILEIYLLSFLFICTQGMNSHVSFEITPSLIKKDFPWMQIFCRTPHFNSSSTFLDFKITRTKDNITKNIAAMQNNGQIHRYCFEKSAEIKGEWIHGQGGYILIKIDEPERNMEGKYQCVYQYNIKSSKTNSIQKITQKSKEIEIDFHKCCTSVEHFYSSIGSQYIVFETVLYFIRLRNRIENQKKDKEFNELSVQLNKMVETEENYLKQINESKQNKEMLDNLETRIKNYIKKMDVKTGRLNNLTGASLYDNLESVMKPYSLGYRTRAVILRRVSASVDFDRTYKEYEEGFGELDGNLWLGLKKMHELTKYRTSLHVTLIHPNGTRVYVDYGVFKVGNTSSGYELTLQNYIQNSHYNDKDSLLSHNGQKFTAKDVDQDKKRYLNCAQKLTGGFWYNNCHKVHPTGKYGVKGNDSALDWYHFTGYFTGCVFIEFSISLS